MRIERHVFPKGIWPFYIYENAAAVKRAMTSSLSVQSSSVTTTHPVDPDTSIRRQGGMSMFFQGFAIRKRTSRVHAKNALTLKMG